MSKPPVLPDKSTSGIALDPKTLDRVVPESRRPDGSIRKEIKIRPGFTPQEDVSRFRGKRQAQMDQNTLPKGHILGWVAPSKSRPAPEAGGGAVGKSAKKNEKRKEKRDKKKEEVIRANWEEDDIVKDEDGAPNWAETAKVQGTKSSGDDDAKRKKSEDADDFVHGQLEKLSIR